MANPFETGSDAEGLLAWLRAEELSECTIAALMTHYGQCSGGNRQLFSHKVKWQRRSALSDVQSNESWYDPLFLLWLSTGMRNGAIRGLTRDCIR